MGRTVSILLDQGFPPKSKFTVDDIPDLSGKIVIVTGGNSGIGKETVKALLAHNARVYLAARSRGKADAAIQELKAETGKEAIFLELDLGNLKKVKEAAEAFYSKEKELHILFNNAGVMFPPKDQLTADGYDLQWGTNVLGPFFFTELLIPALVAGAATSKDGKSRIVTTSSIGNYFGSIDWETFRDGPARRKTSNPDLYHQAKLANVIIARQYAARYGDKGIVATSVNPGNIRTELQRHTSAAVMKVFAPLFLHRPPFGALTQLYAGTSPETLNSNGKFFIPWAREGEPNPVALDTELGERLWNWCQEQVKPFQA